MTKITEDAVEIATLEYLQSMGYTIKTGECLSPEGAECDRADYRQVVLRDGLRNSLMRLNPKLPAQAVEQAVNKLANIDDPALIVANRNFHRMLVNGVKVDYSYNNEQVGALVRVVDFENVANNEFLAVNQYTIKGPERERRPDVLTFINGLPLGVLELKNPASEEADVWGAYEQIQTYKNDITELFKYNAVCVISDFTTALMGSITASKERFLGWRTIDGETLDPLGKSAQLETLVRGVFQPELFLKYIRHFILFEEEGKITKKIAGYHQFHAVLAAAQSVVTASRPNGTKKGGVVWHTQGAGKSIEMVCSSAVIMTHPAMENPTIVVVTDRNDLDGQLFETFAKSEDLLREKPVRAESREELRALLNARPSGGIIFTTIQKFALDANETVFPKLTERHNVVVKCDEAHRTQYGFAASLRRDGTIKYGYAKHLRDALPNATFLAFTGTPISAADKDTRAVFGDYVHIYDIQDAVDDGATVPVYYESRLVKLDLKPEETPTLDSDFEELTEDEEENTAEAHKRKWTAVEKLVGAQSRIDKVAADFIAHFEARQQASSGKALFVAMSREICVALYDAIVKLRPDWHDKDPSKGKIKIVMTGSASDKQALQAHLYSKDQKKLLEKRFKDPEDELKVVIVRDMWLTGFDAPVINTLYVDKPMKGHNLMQAIARANRVFKDKPGGLVVDYIGIANELKSALAEYTSSRGKGNPTIDAEDALVVLKDHMDLARKVLHGCDYSTFRTKALVVLPKVLDHILAQANDEKEKDGRRIFADHVLTASKAFALCCTLDDAAEYRDELAFFQAVKAVLTKAEKKGTTAQLDKEQALRQLVSDALTSEGVVDIFKVAGLDKPDISVLSDEFLEDVKNMEHRNLAVELLQRLLNDEIKSKFRTNVVQQKKFSELLRASLNRYSARAVETAQVIEELIAMAKQFAEAAAKGTQLGLNTEELSFYDALSTDEASVRELGDDVLKKIAQELVQNLRRSVSVDWSKRESVQAKIRLLVKRILRMHKYPPDPALSEATELVLKQAELFSAEWTR